nr:hypothetical protein CPGR_02753 [Mycolicibacter nonchromogenicus]
MSGNLGVRVEHGIARDVSFDSGRCGYRGDDVAHRGHRLVAGAGALGTVEEDLHVCRLAVHALRTRSGQRITPEILDVLHMLVIGFELVDDLVVVLVRLVAELVLALQHDHRRGVRVVLLKHLADVQHALIRRRIRRAQRHLPHFGDGVEGGHKGAQRHHHEHPEDDDRQREDPDHVAQERAVRLRVCGAHSLAPLRGAHTDFTKQ